MWCFNALKTRAGVSPALSLAAAGRQLGENDDEHVGDDDVRGRNPAPGEQDGDEPGALRLPPQGANRVHGVTAGKLATSTPATPENACTTIATSLAS